MTAQRLPEHRAHPATRASVTGTGLPLRVQGGLARPRITAAGTRALLMDVSHGPFDLEVQRRLWHLASEAGPLARTRWVRDVVLGINNVMVTFDPTRQDVQEAVTELELLWTQSMALDGSGRLLQVPVAYDTSSNFDMQAIAVHTGLSMEEVIRIHTSVDYHVACIGFLPGFAYLVGMPGELATPRRATPRAKVPKGAVAIGGAQTGVIPLALPSGWNLMGVTQLEVFDLSRPRPCLLQAGDRVRFVARSVS